MVVSIFINLCHFVNQKTRIDWENSRKLIKRIKMLVRNYCNNASLFSTSVSYMISIESIKFFNISQFQTKTISHIWEVRSISLEKVKFQGHILTENSNILILSSINRKHLFPSLAIIHAFYQKGLRAKVKNDLIKMCWIFY